MEQHHAVQCMSFTLIRSLSLRLAGVHPTAPYNCRTAPEPAGRLELQACCCDQLNVTCCSCLLHSLICDMLLLPSLSAFTGCTLGCRNAYWAEIDAEVDGYLPEQTLMPDMIHPSMHGVRLLGGLVIKFLTDAGVHMTQLGQKSHPSTSHLPRALYIDASLDEQSSTCTRGDALQDMMMQKEDWYWVEGKKPGED